MKDPKAKNNQRWKPLTAGYCCSADDRVILRTMRSSKNMRSFRKVSSSESSSSIRSWSGRMNEEAFAGDLHQFQLSELRGATQSFADHFLLGQGGFGKVHKGFLVEGLRPGLKPQPVAVKLLNIHDSLQGHREWLAEVIFLGQLRHPNLVKLIGYCCEDEDRLLVYEFMPRGSLENHLFKRISVCLPWATRLKIAIGAAKGLAFLHGADTPVIYRDFKASNILLDSDFNAKLSDFGLAKMGPEGSNTHVTTRVMGTYGYAAPEYVNTGHLTTKSDIYSFGVVLLEFLTGRRAMDKTRPQNEQNLVDWARPYLTSSRRLHYIMDPRFAGQYSVKGAREMGLLAHQCVSLNPKDRPKMPTIIETLENLENLRDMAISNGHWPVSSKLGWNTGCAAQGRRQSGLGYSRRTAAVAATPKTK